MPVTSPALSATVGENLHRIDRLGTGTILVVLHRLHLTVLLLTETSPVLRILRAITKVLPVRIVVLLSSIPHSAKFPRLRRIRRSIRARRGILILRSRKTTSRLF